MTTASGKPVSEREVVGPNHGSSRPALLLRAAALVMGASFFAYLLGVPVHEAGHYAGSAIAGVPNEGVVLHPFDLSYNDYGDLSEVTQLRLALSQAAGPVLNVLLGVSVSLLAWRRRSAAWLPIVMWGPVAVLQEGVGMIIGLVDYPDVESDWVSVMLAGVPPAAIGLLSAALLVAGSVWVLMLIPLAGLRAEDTFGRKALVFMAGIPLLLVSAVVYLQLFGTASSSPEGMVEQNRMIALGASVAFVVILAALHKPLFPRLDGISHTDPEDVSGRDVGLALSLGAAVFIFELVFFN